MAGIDDSLDTAMMLPGALAVALVDLKSGLCLSELGSNGRFDLEVAASGNAEVIRSMMIVTELLDLDDSIEEFLITLGRNYHLIRMVHGKNQAFLYLALDKEKTNLGLARYQLAKIESELVFV